MPQPTGSDVHIDGPLSNIATAYKNQRYIGSQVFPEVPVTKQSDKYYVWTKSFWFRNMVEKRAPGDKYPEAGIGLSSDSYYTDIFHLAFPINDEDVKNQDAAVQLQIVAAEWLQDQFLLNRESKISTDFFVTGVWTDVVGGTGFTKWSDFDNSDPPVDVDTGMSTVQGKTGVDPNVLVIGREVFDKLKRHPVLLDIFKHTGKGILTEDMVRDGMGIQRLLVGQSIQTTTREGVAEASVTYTRLWGKNGLLLYVTPTPGLRVPTAGYTFVWPVDGEGLLTPITRVREDNRDRELIRGKHAFDDKAVGTDLGYFFSNAVA